MAEFDSQSEEVDRELPLVLLAGATGYVGSSDVVTYGQLIQEYAQQRGLSRWLISVPLLTPRLSSLWLGLVTPATAEVGRHLIEGLRNPTIVRDKKALEVFPIRPMGMQDAIKQALEEKDKVRQSDE